MQTAANRVKRTEIARTAALLFEENGYHATSVADIAEAVGLSKPTLYHYVKSKGEIVSWIHDEVMDLLLARLEERVAGEMRPEEIIRLNILDIIEAMDTRPGHLKVYFEHHKELPAALRREAKVKRDRFQALIEETIDRGIQTGVFRQLDIRMTTLALFGITNWSYQWYRPEGAQRSNEVAQHLFDLFMNGVTKRADLH